MNAAQPSHECICCVAQQRKHHAWDVQLRLRTVCDAVTCPHPPPRTQLHGCLALAVLTRRIVLQYDAAEWSRLASQTTHTPRNTQQTALPSRPWTCAIFSQRMTAAQRTHARNTWVVDSQKAHRYPQWYAEGDVNLDTCRGTVAHCRLRLYSSQRNVKLHLRGTALLDLTIHALCLPSLRQYHRSNTTQQGWQAHPSRMTPPCSPFLPRHHHWCCPLPCCHQQR